MREKFAKLREERWAISRVDAEQNMIRNQSMSDRILVTGSVIAWSTWTEGRKGMRPPRMYQLAPGISRRLRHHHQLRNFCLWCEIGHALHRTLQRRPGQEKHEAHAVCSMQRRHADRPRLTRTVSDQRPTQRRRMLRIECDTHDDFTVRRWLCAVLRCRRAFARAENRSQACQSVLHSMPRIRVDRNRLRERSQAGGP